MMQEVQEWLDERIVAYRLLGKSFNPTGDLEYWECPRCIEVHPSDRRIHIDKIELLAKYTELPLTTVEISMNGDTWKETSMMYNGYQFFEIQKEKEE